MSKDRFQRLGGNVWALNPPAENIGQGEASRVSGWIPGRIGSGLKKRLGSCQNAPKDILCLGLFSSDPDLALRRSRLLCRQRIGHFFGCIQMKVLRNKVIHFKVLRQA